MDDGGDVVAAEATEEVAAFVANSAATAVAAGVARRADRLTGAGVEVAERSHVARGCSRRAVHPTIRR